MISNEIWLQHGSAEVAGILGRFTFIQPWQLDYNEHGVATESLVLKADMVF